MDDYGKFKLYSCICGATPARPLRSAWRGKLGNVRPCDHCLSPLNDRPFTIEDRARYTDRISAERRKGRQGRKEG